MNLALWLLFNIKLQIPDKFHQPIPIKNVSQPWRCFSTNSKPLRVKAGRQLCRFISNRIKVVPDAYSRNDACLQNVYLVAELCIAFYCRLLVGAWRRRYPDPLRPTRNRDPMEKRRFQEQKSLATFQISCRRLIPPTRCLLLRILQWKTDFCNRSFKKMMKKHDAIDALCKHALPQLFWAFCDGL